MLQEEVNLYFCKVWTVNSVIALHFSYWFIIYEDFGNSSGKPAIHFAYFFLRNAQQQKDCKNCSFSSLNMHYHLEPPASDYTQSCTLSPSFKIQGSVFLQSVTPLPESHPWNLALLNEEGRRRLYVVSHSVYNQITASVCEVFMCLCP